jgi:hypothetical protein
VLANSEIEAVVVATPLQTHYGWPASTCCAKSLSARPWPRDASLSIWPRSATGS